VGEEHVEEGDPREEPLDEDDPEGDPIKVE